jgi:7,8-dihydropterin-6-yl-methyl-4-(beta-D-ribofuranosyl)aminobenzene 5'-phosphate synthase
MHLTILTDNAAGGEYLAEFGLSYFIEYDDQRILFDTGHSDVFLKNAAMAGIDLDLIDTIVLSHGHWDHGNGLKYLENKKLITHPAAFMKRYHRGDDLNIGLDLSYEEINKKFDLKLSKRPLHISENIIYLGEIPRINDFESQETNFMDKKGEPDFVTDDSALAIKVNDELVVVTGCSHSGICNIIEYAKEVTKTNRIKAVIGGFHLKAVDERTVKTIEYINNQYIEDIYPSHCTELPALAAFYQSFQIKQVKTGMKFDFI